MRAWDLFFSTACFRNQMVSALWLQRAFEGRPPERGRPSGLITSGLATREGKGRPSGLREFSHGQLIGESQPEKGASERTEWIKILLGGMFRDWLF